MSYYILVILAFNYPVFGPTEAVRDAYPYKTADSCVTKMNELNIKWKDKYDDLNIWCLKREVR